MRLKRTIKLSLCILFNKDSSFNRTPKYLAGFHQSRSRDEHNNFDFYIIISIDDIYPTAIDIWNCVLSNRNKYSIFDFKYKKNEYLLAI